jgi:hypothetical protein
MNLAKPQSCLQTDDILGARPQCVKFTTNRLGTNPLNPSYSLQKVEFVAPQPTRFVRDQMSIDDIEGSRPLKRKSETVRTRAVMDISDIEGTKAAFGNSIKPRERTAYDNMNYRDVTHDVFKTSRHVNPLLPSYTVRDDKGGLAQIGPVEGSHSCVLPPERKDKNYQCTTLKTNDILGCGVGTKGLGNFHSRVRREYK